MKIFYLLARMCKIPLIPTTFLVILGSADALQPELSSAPGEPTFVIEINLLL